MLDVWIIDSALLIWLAWFPFYLVRRRRPRVCDGPGIVLEAMEGHSAPYLRRQKLRIAGWLFCASGLAVLLGHCFFVERPPENLPQAAMSGCLLAVVGAGSFLGATIWQYRLDKAFIAGHPEFEGGLQPLSIRIFPILVLLVLALLLMGAILLQDPLFVFSLIASALLVSAISRRRLVKAITKNQVEVPIDSPLGQSIAKVVRDFGFTPKRVVQIPSLIANGMAWPDGSVLFTTALRVITTEAQLEAILAHELSHARDRDANKMQRKRRIYAVILILPAAAMVGWLRFSAISLTLVLLAALLIVPTLQWMMARASQRLEYKCDLDAVRHGLGEELREGLRSLSRYAGLPPRWHGVDRRIMTHPDFEDRSAAIAKAIASLPQSPPAP